MGPALEGNRERVLDGILRQVEVAEGADEGGDGPPRLLAKGTPDGVGAQRAGSATGDGTSRIGRTSIVPTRAAGMREASSIASSMSSALTW